MRKMPRFRYAVHRGLSTRRRVSHSAERGRQLCPPSRHKKFSCCMWIPVVAGHDFWNYQMEDAPMSTADGVEAALNLNDLWVDLQPRLTRYAMMMRQGADADDVVQEAALVATQRRDFLEHLPTKNDQVRWMFGVVRNKVLAARQQHIDIARVFAPLADDALVDTISGAPSPEDLTLQSERRALLLRALNALSDRQREAIVLRLLEGFSIADIATIMKTHQTTVRTHLSRAVEKLELFVR
jgi:RNA polymerase sigma-70 factor, ECF subfamily